MAHLAIRTGVIAASIALVALGATVAPQARADAALAYGHGIWDQVSAARTYAQIVDPVQALVVPRVVAATFVALMLDRLVDQICSLV